MQPEDYQIADEALVDGWLDDATLGATLGALATWRGFFGSLEEADDELSTPATPPAKPAAGAYYALRYARPPTKALAGNVFVRNALLDLFIRIQPGTVAGDSARATVLQITQAIKARLLALALAEAQVDAETPLAPLAPRGGWPEFRLIVPLLLGET